MPYSRRKDDSMNVNPLRKDVVIIGGGIAGLTAAMHTSMMALDGMVIQKTPYLGQIPESIRRKNYPGLRNVTGEELSRNIEEQVEKDFSVDIKREEVVDIILNSSGVPYRFLVKTEYGHYLAKCVILATGSRPEQKEFGSNVPKGISYYPLFDAHEFQGKDVIIVGIKDSSVQFVSWLIAIAKSITLIEGSNGCTASPMNLHELENILELHKDKIRIYREHDVDSIDGKDHVEKVNLRNIQNNERTTLNAGAVIICSRRIPNSELARRLGCDLDKHGFIHVNRDQKTEVQGMFAAGDVTGIVFAAVKSAGEGCVAGLKAAEYLGTGIW